MNEEAAEINRGQILNVILSFLDFISILMSYRQFVLYRHLWRECEGWIGELKTRTNNKLENCYPSLSER